MQPSYNILQQWHIVWIIWDSKGATIIWGTAVTNAMAMPPTSFV
jgi:hypothetical protein